MPSPDTETPDVLLRRAADRLDRLREAATPEPWARYEDWTDAVGVVRLRSMTGKLPDVAELRAGSADRERADADLVVTLRPLARCVARILREAADDLTRSGRLTPHPIAIQWEYASAAFSDELAIARSVLGETGT